MNSNRERGIFDSVEKSVFCERERATLTIPSSTIPKFVKSSNFYHFHLLPFLAGDGLLLYLYSTERDLCNLYSLNGKTGLLFVQNREAFKKVLTKGFTAFIIKAYRERGRYRTKKRSSKKDLKKSKKVLDKQNRTRYTNSVPNTNTQPDVKKYVHNKRRSSYENRNVSLLLSHR